MYFSKLFIAAVASAVVSAAPQPSEMAADSTVAYPLCPAGYDTACCMLLFPSTSRCRGRGSNRKCEHGQAWSCVMGPGKVDSIRTCLENYEDKHAFCKRPGAQYFASAIEWNKDHFEPMIEPSMYRQYLKPGMPKPWVPKGDEITWDTSSAGEAVEIEVQDDGDDEPVELRLEM